MWISSDFLRLKEKARVSTGSGAPRSAGSVDTHFILSATAPPVFFLSEMLPFPIVIILVFHVYVKYKSDRV